MPNEPQDPATQDTPPKLYGGKFKTPEELEAAYQESVKSHSQIAEENDRMQRYIALMDRETPAPPAPDEPPVEEEEVPPVVKKYVERALTQKEIQIRKARELETEFFSKHKDLVGQDKLVLLHTQELRSDPTTRTMSMPQIMDEVAKRVRTHIEQIRQNGHEPPPRSTGGSHGEKPTATRNQAPASDADTLSDYMQEERERKTKQMARR